MHYLAWPALHPARYTKVPAEPRLVTQSALAGCCQGRRHRTARGTARGGEAAPLCRTASSPPRQAATGALTGSRLIWRTRWPAAACRTRASAPAAAPVSRRTPAPPPGARGAAPATRGAPAPDAAAREPGGRQGRPNLRPIRNPNPSGATLAARRRVGDQRLRQAARRAAPGDAAQAAAAHGARQLPARQHQRPALADGVQHLCARAAAQRESPMQRACPMACGPAPLGHQQRLWQAGGQPARSPSNARLDAPKARAASTRCPYTRPLGSSEMDIQRRTRRRTPHMHQGMDAAGGGPALRGRAPGSSGGPPSSMNPVRRRMALRCSSLSRLSDALGDTPASSMPCPLLASCPPRQASTSDGARHNRPAPARDASTGAFISPPGASALHHQRASSAHDPMNQSPGVGARPLLLQQVRGHKGGRTRRARAAARLAARVAPTRYRDVDGHGGALRASSAAESCVSQAQP